MSAFSPRLCLVVAAAENGVIGRSGALPWTMPADLKMFRRLTISKPVIMGRKTWDSIGKPLAERDNIVITRNPAFAPAGAIVVPDLVAAVATAEPLALARGADEIMVIGGAQIYAQALPRAARIYLTRIHGLPEGDAVFADPDPAVWREVRRTPIEAGDRDEFQATLLQFDRRP